MFEEDLDLDDRLNRITICADIDLRVLAKKILQLEEMLIALNKGNKNDTPNN